MCHMSKQWYIDCRNLIFQRLLSSTSLFCLVLCTITLFYSIDFFYCVFRSISNIEQCILLVLDYMLLRILTAVSLILWIIIVLWSVLKWILSVLFYLILSTCDIRRIIMWPIYLPIKIHPCGTFQYSGFVPHTFDVQNKNLWSDVSVYILNLNSNPKTIHTLLFVNCCTYIVQSFIL